jgi:hypothetical protein
MSLYDSMQSPQQVLSSLRANPAQVLRQRGLNIPAGMTNPQQIVQHLLSSGQIPQARYQQALQMMGRNSIK